MIDKDILKILETNFEDPSYSVVVTKFEQPDFCNKDQVQISVQQFSPNLEKIIENNQQVIRGLSRLLKENSIEIPDYLYEMDIGSCIEKTLTIESVLRFNQADQTFISGLDGYMNNDVDKKLRQRLVSGNIKKRRITIDKKDNPNIFNKAKFRIKENNFVISIPKKIKTLELLLETKCLQDTIDVDGESVPCVEDSQVFTEADIVDNTITIPVNFNDYYYKFNLSYTINDSLLLQDIESIVTKLKKEIKIEFNNLYIDIPAIITTIDTDDKVYNSYSTKFETNEDNYYENVTITFNGLKRQKEYGDINITIIGTKAKSE